MKTLDFRAFLWYNFLMKTKIFTAEELNHVSKDMVIKMYLQLAESFDRMSVQLENLTEQVAILTQQKFGRKTEKASAVTSDQITIADILAGDMKDVLNEAEATAGDSVEEPDLQTITYKRKKKVGKRAADLSQLELVVDEPVTLTEEELNARFPDGYRRLPDEIYYEVEYVPARLLAHERHIAVYAGKNDSGIAKAKRPERLLSNSLLTTSLAAGIIDAKFVNHIPLNRQAEDFRRRDFEVSKQVLSGWVIKAAQRYLRVVFEHMKKKLLTSVLIHCDETPFKVVRNGRGPSSKDYMWVYHTCERYGCPPIYLYVYEEGRRDTQALRAFLGDYEGILMTDGYQVYHTAANENPEKLTVAGCWTHCKRKYAEYVKGVGTEGFRGTIADEGVKRIQAIYHMENMVKGKTKTYKPTDEEILRNRQALVKPVVDSYFEWVKKTAENPLVDKGSKVMGALTYSIHQEPFLREFLDNPLIPLDNNDAERSIRSFCVGKHSWHIIATKEGAQASAILYSIAETAKANNLKTFEYFQYLLDQILLHLDDAPDSYLDDLMPWSANLPEHCRKNRF